MDADQPVVVYFLSIALFVYLYEPSRFKIKRYIVGGDREISEHITLVVISDFV